MDGMNARTCTPIVPKIPVKNWMIWAEVRYLAPGTLIPRVLSRKYVYLE